MSIASIVEALRNAKGRERGIEVAIFREIGLTDAQERACKSWCQMDGRTDLTRDDYIAAWAPTYTRAMDDALTLIPAGLYWMVGFGKCREEEPLGACAIYRPGDEDDPIAQAEGATAPISVCIAALMAREIVGGIS